MGETYLQAEFPGTGTSFPVPVPAPTTDPDVGPFVCWRMPTAYVRLALGALYQLQQPFTWQAADDTARRLTLNRMDTLLSNLAAAARCPEAGMVSITIAAGTATGIATVTFPTAFTAAPVLAVSCDNPVLIPSFASKSNAGFTAVVTARFNVSVDTVCEFDWIASVAA